MRSELHQDLVVLHAEVDYNALIYKTSGLLGWFAERVNSPFMFKTDDDTYLNIPMLMRLVADSHTPRARLLLGRRFVGSGVVNDDQSRFFNPTYRADTALPLYPTYMSGAGYLVSTDIVRAILAMQAFVPLQMWPREDATFATWTHAFSVLRKDEAQFSTLPNDELGWCYAILVHYLDVNNVSLAVEQCRRKAALQQDSFWGKDDTDARSDAREPNWGLPTCAADQTSWVGRGMDAGTSGGVAVVVGFAMIVAAMLLLFVGWRQYRSTSNTGFK